jgi:hypothetical protein
MKIPLGEVVAVRELEFVHHDGRREPVRVSIGKPIPGEDEHEWQCPYLIKAESFERLSRVMGGDSMQALILTVYIISAQLEGLGREHKGAFTYFDGDDLGFPSHDEKKSKY